jgi:hypothetical protein
MSHLSYPLDGGRERLRVRRGAETRASTRSDAIDTAIRHYLEDVENKKEHWEQFTPEQLRLLNTSELKVSFYPKFR